MEKREVVLSGLAAAGGESYSPVQVQKLYFLMDRMIADDLGGPIFDFQPYHYGPFDREVYQVIRDLELEGLAETIWLGGMTHYRATTAGVMTGCKIMEGMPARAAEYIRDASSFVRRLGFSELVSAIYRAYPEMRENSVFRS